VNLADLDSDDDILKVERSPARTAKGIRSAPGKKAITNSEELRWAFRLMAVTLVALSGNMMIVSSYAAPYGVRMAGILMMFSAAGLGVLTALIPSAHNWFTISYSCVGFAFSIAYASQNVRLIGYTGGPNDNKVFPLGGLASVLPP
jgi:hypothetical protein